MLRAAGPIALMLLAAALPARAGTVNYVLDFTVGTGILAPPAGSFNYDPSTGILDNFIVVWNGISFNMDASIESQIGSELPTSCYGNATGGEREFLLLTSAACDAADDTWGATAASPTASMVLFNPYAYSFVMASAPFGGLAGGTGGFTAYDPPGPPDPPDPPDPPGPTGPEPGSGVLAAIGAAIVLLRRAKKRVHTDS